MSDMRVQAELMAEREVPSLYYAEEASSDLLALRESLLSSILADDIGQRELEIAELRAAHDRFVIDFAALASLSSDDVETTLVGQTNSAWTEIQRIESTIADPGGDVDPATLVRLVPGLQIAADEADSLLEQIVQRHETAMEDRKLALASEYASARNMSLVAAGLALVLGLLTAILVGSGTAQSVRQVATAAARLAAGDAGARAQVHSGDEVQDLADAFNTMASSLQRQSRDVELATQDLIDSEERLRLALQAAQMGTWDVDLHTGNVVWSGVVVGLLDLEVGAHPDLNAFVEVVHPEDQDMVRRALSDAIATTTEFDAEFRVVWRDASVHWLEAQGQTLFAQPGRGARLAGVLRDITSRKLAEAEADHQREVLQASEERFRRQYKSFPLPTYSWSDSGDDFVLREYNDAANSATEGKIGDALGERASEWYADVPEILADLRACAENQRASRREMLYHFRTTGLDRQLALSYVFVPPGTVMIHTEDLTEAMQAEQQREAMARSEKLRALGQMASGVAHDLNQSLMLVASYSNLARQALTENPPNLSELEELLGTTTRAAMDGGETVKRLLLFTRSAPEQDTRVIDLGSVVRDAAQLTAPRWRDTAQAEGRHISLHVEVAGYPTIQGSPAQLREVMTNLIFNAVDALPAGGTIRLRAAVENNQSIVEISDSGVGMSEAVQRRVFEPFFTTKGEAGTGLGLAMVFRIIDQHGGQIDVRSAPGDGTTFRITLPLVKVLAVAPAPLSAHTQLAPCHALRVLVVDDEPMMTRAVARMLRPSGHTVSVAGSAEEALHKLAGQTFDVVVSDMGMGAGMNGWELADAVKSRWPDVRFMLATGWGAAISQGAAREKGVERVLAKPYQTDDLLQALARTDAAA